MRKILLLICGILIMSNPTLAEDATETCANGAGTLITGAVTGNKYCKSNSNMNWWNANAWCDSLGKQVFNLADCACSDTTSNCAGNICPELALGGDRFEAWTNDFFKKEGVMQTHKIYTDVGRIRFGSDGQNLRPHTGRAVCK